jgi:ornithine cyclodeaminase/alanine dehydrogenase-like protein (mu-crystallin family)
LAAKTVRARAGRNDAPQKHRYSNSESEIFEMPRREAAPAQFMFLDQCAVIAAGVLDMPRAMDAVGEAFGLYAEQQCRQPHKVVLRQEDNAECEEYGRINGLCASLGRPVRALGMKWIASFPQNRDRGLPRASALLILNSPETGFPIAIMDGTVISAMRTGAVTALGARFLAPRPARKIGIIGAGVQARTQILGLKTALPEVEEIAVYNRTRRHADLLAEECWERWAIEIVPVNTAQQALRDADVALTITTAGEPVMLARHINPGALTVQLSGHECEFELISQCKKIVTDDWEVLKHRGIMSPALMYAQGLLADVDIYASLGELILGLKPGREDSNERIHFAHMGMGIADVALGSSVYERALEKGLGECRVLWNEPLWA